MTKLSFACNGKFFLLVLREQVPGHTQERLAQKTQMVSTWHTVFWLITPAPLLLLCLMAADLTTQAEG